MLGWIGLNLGGLDSYTKVDEVKLHFQQVQLDDKDSVIPTTRASVKGKRYI